jgi:hypothetical protein
MILLINCSIGVEQQSLTSVMLQIDNLMEGQCDFGLSLLLLTYISVDVKLFCLNKFVVISELHMK